MCRDKAARLLHLASVFTSPVSDFNEGAEWRSAIPEGALQVLLLWLDGLVGCEA